MGFTAGPRPRSARHLPATLPGSRRRTVHSDCREDARTLPGGRWRRPREMETPPPACSLPADGPWFGDRPLCFAGPSPSPSAASQMWLRACCGLWWPAGGRPVLGLLSPSRCYVGPWSCCVAAGAPLHPVLLSPAPRCLLYFCLPVEPLGCRALSDHCTRGSVLAVMPLVLGQGFCLVAACRQGCLSTVSGAFGTPEGPVAWGLPSSSSGRSGSWWVGPGASPLCFCRNKA